MCIVPSADLYQASIRSWRYKLKRYLERRFFCLRSIFFPRTIHIAAARKDPRGRNVMDGLGDWGSSFLAKATAEVYPA